MSETHRSIYGRALGTTLVGLAGLTSQELTTCDAKAESTGIRVLTSESKYTVKYELPLAFPNNPNGVEICPTGDLDGDGLPDLLVGSPEGSDGAAQFMSAAKSKSGHKLLLDDNKQGLRIGNRIKWEPPDKFGLVSGAASGSSSVIKLHGWDRDPSHPPELADQRVAFPGQTMRKGVFVATGDLDGDGRTEVVAGSSGDVGQPGAVPAASSIRIGTIEPGSAGMQMNLGEDFYPYGQSYTGGVRVATGDVDGDGLSDIVTVGDFGTYKEIIVVSEKLGGGRPQIWSSFRIDSPPGSDVNVAVGDLTGDGSPDLCVSDGRGDKDLLRVFSWTPGSTVSVGGGSATIDWTLAGSFSVLGNNAYDGGFNLVIQDVTGDGIGDIIAAPASVVPEPSAVALLGVTAMCRRRRRCPP